jgi:L-ascorbate metabolism protein UlaG (beta-lactamase superfamily)
MRTVRLFMMLAGALLLISGCGAGGSGDVRSPSSSPSSVATEPATAPPASGVTIRYEGNAQVEVSLNGGARVLIDVYDPSALSAPPTADDILLTTHTHDDHLSPDFRGSFPGRQLFVREGAIKTPGAVTTGTAAAHNEGDPLLPKNGTDYIFVIDIGGLRIAHFGDLGQTALTAGQLEALGDVDIAVTQFENSFSHMDATNKKGFVLMEQVKPRLILQTHTSPAAVQYAGTLWPVLFSGRSAVTITAADLPAETSLLLLGDDAAFYAGLVPAEKVDW